MSSIECRLMNIRRIETNYRKKYSEEQRQMIDRCLERLPDQGVVRVVDKFIATKRTLPLPSEFTAEAREMGFGGEYHQQAYESRIRCVTCLDTGYALHRVSKEMDRSVWADCYCREGESPMNGSTGERIRVIASTLPFPAERFLIRPTADEGMFDQMTKRRNTLLAEIESSRIYWQGVKQKND